MPVTWNALLICSCLYLTILADATFLHHLSSYGSDVHRAPARYYLRPVRSSSESAHYQQQTFNGQPVTYKLQTAHVVPRARMFQLAPADASRAGGHKIVGQSGVPLVMKKVEFGVDSRPGQPRQQLALVHVRPQQQQQHKYTKAVAPPQHIKLIVSQMPPNKDKNYPEIQQQEVQHYPRYQPQTHNPNIQGNWQQDKGYQQPQYSQYNYRQEIHHHPGPVAVHAPSGQPSVPQWSHQESHPHQGSTTYHGGHQQQQPTHPVQRPQQQPYKTLPEPQHQSPPHHDQQHVPYKPQHQSPPHHDQQHVPYKPQHQSPPNHDQQHVSYSFQNLQWGGEEGNPKAAS